MKKETGSKQAKFLGSQKPFLQMTIPEIMENADWNQIGTGALKAASGLAVFLIGCGVLYVTGGAALPAVMALINGTAAASTSLITLGTVATGFTATAFGLADLLEAEEDVRHGLMGGGPVAFNPVRDTIFAGNEDLYYLVEALAAHGAISGLYVYQSYDMGSQLGVTGSADLENNSIGDQWSDANGDDSIPDNPQLFLQKALKNQKLDEAPNGLKEVWIEGDYKYTVRIHEGNTKYTNANTIYRVSRQGIVLDANG